MGISPTLNIPQARFLAMPHKFKSYVAGFGSGKTWVGCGGICKGMWEFPKINQGYFAPTYPLVCAPLPSTGGFRLTGHSRQILEILSRPSCSIQLMATGITLCCLREFRIRNIPTLNLA